VDAPGRQLQPHLRFAFEVHDLDPGCEKLVDLRGHHVRNRTWSVASEIHRRFLREIDELAEAAGRDVAMHGERKMTGIERGDESEVLVRVVRQFFVQGLRLHDRRRDGKQERVAVGGRFGDGVAADEAARARPVLDQDRLADAA